MITFLCLLAAAGILAISGILYGVIGAYTKLGIDSPPDSSESDDVIESIQENLELLTEYYDRLPPTINYSAFCDAAEELSDRLDGYTIPDEELELFDVYDTYLNGLEEMLDTLTSLHSRIDLMYKIEMLDGILGVYITALNNIHIQE